jgi:hypothetical protein
MLNSVAVVAVLAGGFCMMIATGFVASAAGFGAAGEVPGPRLRGLRAGGRLRAPVFVVGRALFRARARFATDACFAAGARFAARVRDVPDVAGLLRAFGREARDLDAFLDLFVMVWGLVSSGVLLDRDLGTLRLWCTHQMDLQHALAVFRVDLILVGRPRQLDHALEVTKIDFRTMVVGT